MERSRRVQVSSGNECKGASDCMVTKKQTPNGILPQGKKGKAGGEPAGSRGKQAGSSSSGSPHTPAPARKQSGGNEFVTPGSSGSGSQPSAGRRARRYVSIIFCF